MGSAMAANRFPYRNKIIFQWSDKKWTIKDFTGRIYDSRADAEKAVDEYLAKIKAMEKGHNK